MNSFFAGPIFTEWYWGPIFLFIWLCAYVIPGTLIVMGIYYGVVRVRRQKIVKSKLIKVAMIGIALSTALSILIPLSINSYQDSQLKSRDVAESKAREEEIRFSHLTDRERTEEGCLSANNQTKIMISKYVTYYDETKNGKDLLLVTLEDPEGYSRLGIPFRMCKNISIVRDGKEVSVLSIQKGQKVEIIYKYWHGEYNALKLTVL